MEEDKKKQIIGGIIVVVCLVGAVIAYRAMSGPTAADDPKAKATAVRDDEIRKGMENVPMEAPPPEIARPKTRGPQKIGG